METLAIDCTGIEEFMVRFAAAVRDGFELAKNPNHFAYVTFDARFHVELEKTSSKKK